MTLALVGHEQMLTADYGAGMTTMQPGMADDQQPKANSLLGCIDRPTVRQCRKAQQVQVCLHACTPFVALAVRLSITSACRGPAVCSQWLGGDTHAA